MRVTVIPEDDALTPVQFSFNAKWQLKQVAAVAEAFRKKQGLALPVVLLRITTRRPVDLNATVNEALCEGEHLLAVVPSIPGAAPARAAAATKKKKKTKAEAVAPPPAPETSPPADVPAAHDETPAAPTAAAEAAPTAAAEAAPTASAASEAASSSKPKATAAPKSKSKPAKSPKPAAAKPPKPEPATSPKPAAAPKPAAPAPGPRRPRRRRRRRARSRTRACGASRARTTRAPWRRSARRSRRARRAGAARVPREPRRVPRQAPALGRRRRRLRRGHRRGRGRRRRAAAERAQVPALAGAAACELGDFARRDGEAALRLSYGESEAAARLLERVAAADPAACVCACGATFGSRAHLFRHALERRHDVFVCDECGDTFRTVGDLEAHARAEGHELLDPRDAAMGPEGYDTGRPLVCPVCGAEFDDERDALAHVEATGHGADDFFGAFAGGPLDGFPGGFAPGFDDRFPPGFDDEPPEGAFDPFDADAWRGGGGGDLRCPRCAWAAPNLAELDVHCERLGHAPHACPYCALRFDSRAELEDHCGGPCDAALAAGDRRPPPHACDCGRAFCSAAALRDHRREESGGGDEPWYCPTCDRPFSSEAALLEHCGGESPEPGAEPKFCSCGVAFCSDAALEKHQADTGHRAADGAAPASPAALRRLKDDHVKATERRARPGETCSICMEPLHAKVEVQALPNCVHLFHPKCAARWFKRAAACPVCRATVEPPAPEPEPERVYPRAPDMPPLRLYPEPAEPSDRDLIDAQDAAFDTALAADRDAAAAKRRRTGAPPKRRRRTTRERRRRAAADEGRAPRAPPQVLRVTIWVKEMVLEVQVDHFGESGAGWPESTGSSGGARRRRAAGALDVDEALAASPTLAALWRSREVPDAGAFRDGAASARAVADEYFVDLVAKSADGATATAALGYAAWLGLPRACAALVARGGDVGFAGGLGRAARRAGAEGPRRWRDALGLSPKALAAKAARGDGDCAVDVVDVDRFPGSLEPYVLRGAPVLPHPIPHGERFGVAAPPAPATLGAYVRSWARDPPPSAGGRAGPDDVADLPAYVFAAGAAAAPLFEGADALGELRKLLAPSAAVDALLDGLPGRLHGAHGGSDQFYCGPAGSGAPLHYHEHAVNFLAHGSKTWWLLPPADAVYSVAHPATWRAPPAGALACVQRAGDVLFAPANWAHAVRNDEPAVGVAVEFPDVFMIHHMNAHMLGYDVAGDRGAGGDDDDRGDGDGDQQGGGDDDPGAALLAAMIPA
ncbi:ubiquitin-protein transferase [Aureococcus anophagefferens]|nr:ubiquitin-protein transferase [Aureococcus anophagefferens]